MAARQEARRAVPRGTTKYRVVLKFDEETQLWYEVTFESLQAGDKFRLIDPAVDGYEDGTKVYTANTNATPCDQAVLQPGKKINVPNWSVEVDIAEDAVSA